MLNLRREADGKRVTVAAAGQIDLSTAPQLEQEVTQALDDGVTNLVVDLAGVDFLDSIGVGVLVRVTRAATASEISISVQGARGWVAQVLKISGVEHYLQVQPKPPASAPGPASGDQPGQAPLRSTGP